MASTLAAPLRPPAGAAGTHVPGIGLNQVYEWNEVPQLPNVLVAMRELATEAA